MPHAPPSHRSEAALDAKLAFLRQPAAFPEPTSAVETIETHMSWVFLTEQHAYKLKKPVCNASLDFRTAASRRHYCEEELRLNRRLAQDVYLEVIPLSLDWQGHMHLGHCGTPVDWLVKMRRLAARDMLDNAIRDRRAGVHDVVRVARRMADFYRACPPANITSAAYLAGLEQQIDSNLRDLCRPEYALCIDHVTQLFEAQRAVLHERRHLFVERVEAGKIVEGHGDLRPEHICIRPEVAIIDCLEFSRDLRTVDPLDELAFLALEIERLFAIRHADVLLTAYAKASGDRPAAALTDFYKALRAGVRARLAIRHLDEERFRHSPEWTRRASAYLQLAQKYLDAIRTPSNR